MFYFLSSVNCELRIDWKNRKCSEYARRRRRRLIRYSIHRRRNNSMGIVGGDNFPRAIVFFVQCARM